MHYLGFIQYTLIVGQLRWRFFCIYREHFQETTMFDVTTDHMIYILIIHVQRYREKRNFFYSIGFPKKGFHL